MTEQKRRARGRRQRKITPTEFGRAYVRPAERILTDLQEADTAAAADKLMVRGLRGVNVPVSFRTIAIAPLLSWAFASDVGAPSRVRGSLLA